MSRRLALLFALALCACPRVTPPGDAGRPPECTARTDCPAGKICTAQQFCDFCDSSGQCSVKELCQPDTRLCALRPGWGTDCATNDQCQAGSWCKQGLCQDRSQVSLCPSGLNGECPQGQRCNRVTTVCEEDLGCSTDADCSAGEKCNTGSRACAPRCTVDTQAQICAAGERCVNELCAQCATTAECGVGLVCDAAGRCSTGARCYTDRDCKVPLACFVQTGACLPKPPPCITNDTCAVDQRCDVPSGTCVPKTCQPDRYEPDDDAPHAFNLVAGTYRGLTLCPGDVDWYAVSLSRGDQLGVNLDADPFSESTFSTLIKDGSGRTVAAGRLLVSYVAPVPSKYYVVVSTSDQFQPYAITLLLSRGTPCDDDVHEPNDTPAQATALNATTQLDGTICPQDQDWFRAVVPAARGLRASLINYDPGKGLLRLCAFAADGGVSLGCSEDPAPAVSAPAAQVAGQPVLLQVLGTNDRLANSYTLNVEFP